MWHGTKKNNSSLIARDDEGLNLSYAKVESRWGRAVYFAVDASYACGGKNSKGFSHYLHKEATLSDGSTVPSGTSLVIFAKV